MGVPQDVPQTQEEARTFAGLDQTKFFLDSVLCLFVRLCRGEFDVRLLSELPDEVTQELIGATPIAGVVIRELVAQVTRQVEAATALGNAQGVLSCLR